MKLKDNLYTINSSKCGEDEITYSLILNEENFIYKAHFPGHPITPGVCIVQIVKELLEHNFNSGFEITKVNNVKFLSPVSPLDNHKIDCCLKKITKSDDLQQVKVQAFLSAGDSVLAKISLTCKNNV